MKKGGVKSAPASVADNRSHRDLYGALIIKSCTLPVTGFLSLAALHVLTEEFGAAGLALFGLIVVIPLIVPFADLGLGGAVVEAVASRRLRTEQFVRDRIVRAFQVLCGMTLLIVLVNSVVSALALWPSLTGLSSPYVNAAMFSAVLSFGLCIPFSLGMRVLLGLQRNDLVVLLQGIAGALGYVYVLVAVWVGFPLWLVVCGPQVSVLIVSMFGCWRASRHLKCVSDFGEGDGSDFRLGRVASSNLVIGIALPVAYQSGRLVIAHLSSLDELAAYTAAFALFAPASAVITAAGQSLWPRFSSMHLVDAPQFRRALRRVLIQFAIFGLLLLAVLALLGPVVSGWVVGNLAADRIVFVMFGILALLISVNYPLGMALMGPRSITFQAVCFTCMAMASVCLSLLLAERLGAVSAVLSPAVALLVCVILPSSWRLFCTEAR